MVKIFILGANGMIGHQLWFRLNQRFPNLVWGSIRKKKEDLLKYPFFNIEKIFDSLDAIDFQNVEKTLSMLKPDIIINCIGITLRKPEIQDINKCLEVNSMFPQRLGFWSYKNNTKLIHFSTDCVFDGKMGHYDELSEPTATDIYGKTKFLGEVSQKNCLTLRVPIIGREIEGKTELLEWFLSQKNKPVSGFTSVYYSGITSIQLSKEVIKIIEKFPELSGLMQISGNKISKFELLELINKYSDTNAHLIKNDSIISDKSLDSSFYSKITGWTPPNWELSIKDIFEDKSIAYDL